MERRTGTCLYLFFQNLFYAAFMSFLFLISVYRINIIIKNVNNNF